VDLDADAYLPDDYVSAPGQRMAAYRRLAEARTTADLEAAVAELRDRYGPLPEAAQRLADVIRLRVLARGVGIAAISRDGDGVLLRPADPQRFGARVRPLFERAQNGSRWTTDGIRLRAEGGFAATVGAVATVLADVSRALRPDAPPEPGDGQGVRFSTDGPELAGARGGRRRPQGGAPRGG
jgi:hypothetical protein